MEYLGGESITDVSRGPPFLVSIRYQANSCFICGCPVRTDSEPHLSEHRHSRVIRRDGRVCDTCHHTVTAQGQRGDVLLAHGGFYILYSIMVLDHVLDHVLRKVMYVAVQVITKLFWLSHLGSGILE